MEKKDKVIILRIAVSMLTILLCLCSYTYISVSEVPSGYSLLSTLPLMYLLSSSLILIPSLFKDFKVFNLVLTVLGFLRYVVLPFLIVYADYYEGRSPVPPSNHHYDLALKLMIYELLALTIVIFILDSHRNKRRSVSNTEVNGIQISSSKFIYAVFIFLSLVTVVVVPRALQSVSFFIPSNRVVDVLKSSSFLSVLSLYFFMISKQLVVLMATWFFYQKYQLTKNKIYIFFSVMVMLINIGIFAGTNRSDIVMCMISTLYILKMLFPKSFVKIAILTIFIVLGIVILIASVRQIASVSKDASKIIDFTDTMQVYLGGPYNVAMAIEMKQMFPQAGHWSVFLYDIFRPMIGINVFIKNLPIDYSVLYYNQRYFFSDKVTQILPMIGQGNLYFGYIGAPLIMSVFISIAYYLQTIIEKSRNLEVCYFLTLAIARMGFMLGQNTMNMVNDMSYNLLLFLFIYLLNKKMILKKEVLEYNA